jgi:hypothetical protein
MLYDNDRYYIFDCNLVLRGNSNGYKTMSSAIATANRRDSSLYNILHSRVINHKAINKNLNLVYKIVIGETLNKKG